MAAPPLRALAGMRADIGTAELRELLRGRIPASVARQFLPEQSPANTVSLDDLVEVAHTRQVRVTSAAFQNQLDILGIRIEDKVDSEPELHSVLEVYGEALAGLHRRLLDERRAESDPEAKKRLERQPHPARDFPAYKGNFLVQVEVDYLGKRWSFRLGASDNVEVRLRFEVRQAPGGAAEGQAGLEIKVDGVTGGRARALSVPADTFFRHWDGSVHLCSSALGGDRLVCRAGVWSLAGPGDAPTLELLMPVPGGAPAAAAAAAPAAAHAAAPATPPSTAPASPSGSGGLPSGGPLDRPHMYVGGSFGGVAVLSLAKGTMREIWVPGVTEKGCLGLCWGPDGLLYVSDRGNVRVIVLNRRGVLVRSLDQGHLSDPRGLAFDTRGRLLVAERQTKCVRVLDPVSGARLHTIRGFSGPWGIAVDPASGCVLVSNRDADFVSVLDVEGRLVRKLNVAGRPSGVCVDGGGLVYVVSFVGKTVSVFRLADGQLLRTIGQGLLEDPEDVVLTESGGLLVTCVNRCLIKELRPDGTLARTIRVGAGAPSRMVLGPAPQD